MSNHTLALIGACLGSIVAIERGIVYIIKAVKSKSAK